MGQASGKRLILAMLVVAVIAASFAWWFQRSRGERVLAAVGSSSSRLIRLAPEVQLWRLQPAVASGSSAAVSSPEGSDYDVVARRDLSGRGGIVHARQALIEDRSYVWDQGVEMPRTWTHALHFRQDGQKATLWFDLQRGAIRCDHRPQALQLNPKVAAGFQAYFREQLADADAGAIP